MRAKSSMFVALLALVVVASAAHRAGAEEPKPAPTPTASPAQPAPTPSAAPAGAPAAAPAAKPAAAPAAPQMTMKEAKQKLGIVVFPAKGQTPELQEAEETACLQWGA
jgi:hypothetical protein